MLLSFDGSTLVRGNTIACSPSPPHLSFRPLTCSTTTGNVTLDVKLVAGRGGGGRVLAMVNATRAGTYQLAIEAATEPGPLVPLPAGASGLMTFEVVSDNVIAVGVFTIDVPEVFFGRTLQSICLTPADRFGNPVGAAGNTYGATRFLFLFFNFVLFLSWAWVCFSPQRYPTGNRRHLRLLNAWSGPRSTLSSYRLPLCLPPGRRR